MNRHTRIIYKIIEMYPEAECELNFMTPFELLIATMLSAQTTDKQVNKVTVDLFRDYGTAELLSKANVEEIKKYIGSLGFFNAKAERSGSSTFDHSIKCFDLLPDPVHHRLCIV